MTSPTSSMGTSAWTVEVLDRICLNGSVPKSARSWAGGQFLAPASGLPMRLRRPWSGPGCDSGGRSLRSPGQGIPAICFATPTVVDVQRTVSAACGSADARQIPDEKFDELFAALGSYRDRLWWRLGCRQGAGTEVLGVTCGNADLGEQLITAAVPHFLAVFVWLRLYQQQMQDSGSKRPGSAVMVDAAASVPPADGCGGTSS